MKTRELEHLFGEWRELTEAEGRAIAGDDWTEVQRHQQRKKHLQLHLLRAKEAWRNLGPGMGAAYLDYEQRFRSVIVEIIALETTNAQLVATRRENTQREFAECNRAAENLRGLNRAYGGAADGHWVSYS